jgi:hypothetical protein
MIKKYLRDKILTIIREWNDSDIYAISFLINFNEDNCYKGIKGFPELTILYNTESDCEDEDLFSEERWNIAFWNEDNESTIIDCDKKNNLSGMLLNWYNDKGIKNIGYECEEDAYDEDMNYIGRGPNGFEELAMLLVDIAKDIHNFKSEKINYANIPIIITDYDYSWYVCKFTKLANPNGQAVNFVKAYNELFADE